MQKQQLQWNSGGWFGGQLGSTIWILVAAVLAGIQDMKAGVVLALLFVIPNAFGLILWRHRNRFSCYAAMQWLLVAVGIFGLMTVFVLDRSGLWYAIQTGGSVSATFGYLIITGVVVVLMLSFYLRFGGNTPVSRS